MKKAKPIRKKEEITKHPDHKIDEDFKGYPHGPATDETIRPATKEQEETADLDNKDGEKREPERAGKKPETDEQESDGSANAFENK